MSDIKKVDEEKDVRDRCFVMMPISDQGDYPKGHFNKIYEYIFKPAIEEAGYEPYRVDENKLCDPIIGKIFSAIQECPMALCDLSNRNPNVLYELGIRQAYDKPVVLVQDEKTERIFDVSGIHTIEYSSERLYEDVLKNRSAITEAIRSTMEGKRNSIIKVVNVKNAEIQKGEVSQEDKIEVLLSGLLEDVKEIKEYNASSKGQFQIKENDLSSARVSTHDQVNKGTFCVRVKHGTTNRDIEKAMEHIKSFIQAPVIYFRTGNILLVDADTRSGKEIQIIKEILEKELGRYAI